MYFSIILPVRTSGFWKLKDDGKKVERSYAPYTSKSALNENAGRDLRRWKQTRLVRWPPAD